MRTRATCGAGFPGTHVLGESLQKQARRRRLPDLLVDVEIIHADCADLTPRGQSRYEIARYTGSTMSTAVAGGKPNSACGGHTMTSEATARDDVTDRLSA